MSTIKNIKIATLCYVTKLRKGRRHVLLARKAATKKAVKYKIANMLNGYGGHREPGESVEEACVRELRDESGIIVSMDHLEEMARITYDNNGVTRVLVHVFMACEYEGDPKDSDEMTDPRWYPIDEIPYAEMPKGDRLVIPHIMRGDKVEGTIWYDGDGRIHAEDIEIVEELRMGAH